MFDEAEDDREEAIQMYTAPFSSTPSIHSFKFCGADCALEQNPEAKAGQRRREQPQVSLTVALNIKFFPLTLFFFFFPSFPLLIALIHTNLCI